MIWTLKVKFCHVEPECHHLIEIDADASLIDLHMAIQEAVNFDNDHLFEFFLGRHPRNRAVKIGNNGGWGDAQEKTQTNDHCRNSQPLE